MKFAGNKIYQTVHIVFVLSLVRSRVRSRVRSHESVPLAGCHPPFGFVLRLCQISACSTDYDYCNFQSPVFTNVFETVIHKKSTFDGTYKTVKISGLYYNHCNAKIQFTRNDSFYECSFGESFSEVSQTTVTQHKFLIFILRTSLY